LSDSSHRLQPHHPPVPVGVAAGGRGVAQERAVKHHKGAAINGGVAKGLNAQVVVVGGRQCSLHQALLIRRVVADQVASNALAASPLVGVVGCCAVVEVAGAKCGVAEVELVVGGQACREMERCTWVRYLVARRLLCRLQAISYTGGHKRCMQPVAAVPSRLYTLVLAKYASQALACCWIAALHTAGRPTR
jgi:hypothetical protein